MKTTGYNIGNFLNYLLGFMYEICTKNTFICYQSSLVLLSFFSIFSYIFNYFKLLYESERVSESHSVMSDSLWPHGLYSPWNSLGQILGWVAFPFSRGSSQPKDRTQVSSIAGGFFYQLSHKGSPRILEWVAYPFSSRSSQPRNRTGVSSIAGGFFTNWAFREATSYCIVLLNMFIGTEKINDDWVLTIMVFKVRDL